MAKFNPVNVSKKPVYSPKVKTTVQTKRDNTKPKSKGK